MKARLLRTENINDMLADVVNANDESIDSVFDLAVDDETIRVTKSGTDQTVFEALKKGKVEAWITRFDERYFTDVDENI